MTAGRTGCVRLACTRRYLFLSFIHMTGVRTASATSSAHTQGPWTIRRPNRVGLKTCIVSKDGIVCDVYGDAAACRIAAANAQIITAAPALLEACQFTLDLLDDLSTGQFAIGGDRPAREKLAAAIARCNTE